MKAFRNLLRRTRLERDMDEEMRFHIEMEAEELMRTGVSPTEALRRATIAFGGLEQQKENARSLRPGQMLEEVLGDARYTARWLRRSPVFTAAAVLTLALGIGSATVIFGAADHVLIRPLPYVDADRIVTLWEYDRSKQETFEFSSGNYLSFRERAQSYVSTGLAEPTGFDLMERGSAESLSAWATAAGFAEALGVRPAFGRSFRPSDYQPGAAPVVLLSHDLWRQKFNADQDIVGRAIRLDTLLVTVIGVLPADLPYPEPRDIWTPKQIREGEQNDRSSRYQLVVARLRPGISAGSAQREAAAIAGALAREYPRTNSDTDVQVKTLEAHVLGPVRPALLVIAAAVACLLLIACANIANLLLARGLEREREIAVRAALGAGRARIARQLLTESVLLCVLGGATGVLLATWGIVLLKRISPPDLPRIASLALDLRILGINALITFVTACVVGMAPALRLSRFDLISDLRGAGQVGGARRASARMRSALVVTEIALAIVLLTGAGLFARSFVRLLDNELGFTPQRRLTVQTFLWDRNETSEQRIERVKAIEAELQRIPGVRAAGATTVMPFHPHQITSTREISIAGAPTPDREQRVYVTAVTPGYFDVVEIEVTRGRGFTEYDRHNGNLVVAVSQSLATSYFPGTDPIGRQIALRTPSRDSVVLREIVGLVRDVRNNALDEEPRQIVYMPHSQSGSGSMTFVVEVAANARVTLDQLSEAVWRIDPGQSIYHSVAAERLIAETVAERKFQLLLLGTFSAIGLLLALVGIYGLITFLVRTRMKEFGLRMALGATPRDVVIRVMRDAIRLNVPGVIAGIAAALILTRFIQHLLYEVDATDPATLTQVAVITLACGLAAALVPAMRAATTSPLDVLRQD